MNLFKRKSKDFIYVFTVNGKAKMKYADSMQEAVDIMITRHMASYIDGDITFIMSNDPSAPMQKMNMKSVGGFFNIQVCLTPLK